MRARDHGLAEADAQSTRLFKGTVSIAVLFMTSKGLRHLFHYLNSILSGPSIATHRGRVLFVGNRGVHVVFKPLTFSWSPKPVVLRSINTLDFSRCVVRTTKFRDCNTLHRFVRELRYPLPLSVKCWPPSAVSIWQLLNNLPVKLHKPTLWWIKLYITYNTRLFNTFSFLPRDALVHSAVLRLHVVRLSVCLSVCLSVRLSVCPSVCDVGGSGSHRLEILETNCTDT